MLIHGMQKLTLLDYPGHLAAVLFTGNCSFRCPFCQNGSLVLTPQSEPVIPEDTVFSFLKKRTGILTGVCVTGGEPTLHADLPQFLEKIKALGYLVKLDTNGTNPSMVRDLFHAHLMDYVAMDIKASRANYARVCGLPRVSLDSVQETADFLMHSGVEYEFRTTVVKGLHTEADFLDIADWLKGCQRYFLQSFQDSEHILQREPGYTAPGAAYTELSSFSPESLEHFRQIVLPAIPSAKLRGVDVQGE